MQQFSINALDVLGDEKDRVDEDSFKKLSVKFYELALKYCLNEADKANLQESFRTKGGVDNIQEWAMELQVLGGPE
jgi:hypothetical protein